MRREPPASQLQDGLDEARIKQMWERIDHAPRHSRAPWILAAITAAAVALLLFGIAPLSRGGEPAQLALESGAAPSVLGSDTTASTPRFDDGSRVSLARGTRLEVLRNDGRSFVTVLRRGEATFDVKPGGPRHWVIEAGELSVEVVGTRFRVERGAAVTRVSVEHGIVLVRGERVPSGGVRLTAGMGFELPASVEPSRSPPSEPAAPLQAPEAAPAPEAAAAAKAKVTASAEPADPVDSSLLAADAARQRADFAAAIRHFDAAFQRARPGDARRGLAGLSLARSLMGGQPAKAAQILRSSLSDMPQALLEDASVRLVEAESRAGNHEAAARAAADYERRFPAGRRADEVRRWSAP